MKKQSFVHFVALALATVLVSYGTLHFSKAEAVYSRAVGTISVTEFVPRASIGYEYIVLSFSGILSRDSVADLSGWKIKNKSGFEYDLSEVVLTNAEPVRLCEEGVNDPACDYVWSGTNVFNDDGGELLILAKDGAPMVYLPYGTVGADVSLQASGDYMDYVYTSGDKVSVCEQKSNGGFRLREVNVQKITRDIDKEINAQVDIVPPFVYEDSKKLGYHPGINWPGGKGILARGCQ